MRNVQCAAKPPEITFDVGINVGISKLGLRIVTDSPKTGEQTTAKVNIKIILFILWTSYMKTKKLPQSLYHILYELNWPLHKQKHFFSVTFL